MPTIDADAHVIETDRTWEFMDEAGRQYKPMVVSPVGGDPDRQYWVIDGQLRSKGFGNIGRDTSRESRELLHVEKRLGHMDELGIDIQVLYSDIEPRVIEKILDDNPRALYGL